MQRVVVQVPMSSELKKNAENVSLDMGFSSLQEAIRVILTKLSKRELGLRIEETEEIIHLSKTAERRYKKAVEDIQAGKNITHAENADELLKLLHS